MPRSTQSSHSTFSLHDPYSKLVSTVTTSRWSDLVNDSSSGPGKKFRHYRIVVFPAPTGVKLLSSMKWRLQTAIRFSLYHLDALFLASQMILLSLALKQKRHMASICPAQSCRVRFVNGRSDILHVNMQVNTPYAHASTRTQLTRINRPAPCQVTNNLGLAITVARCLRAGTHPCGKGTAQ